MDLGRGTIEFIDSCEDLRVLICHTFLASVATLIRLA
jgi:hypothetical protein